MGLCKKELNFVHKKQCIENVNFIYKSIQYLTIFVNNDKSNKPKCQIEVIFQISSEQLNDLPSSNANISIFGSQSTGKSTLINTAFGCHFPVLDTKQGRKRCTKGVWFENNGKFNIIDTEGFDSVERSKDERIFERQIALFCLAVSEVVIVNLWMNEIGRYQGSQIHILKAIINAANSLIQSQSKTLIFVVKDCSPDASHDILKEELQNQVNSIIESNPSKGPKSLKFNLEFFFMSHYTYRRQDFEKEALKLQNLIKIKKSNLNSYEAEDKITYLNHIWDTILANNGEIDLRLEEEALRSHVVNRIRREVKEEIERNVLIENRVGKRNSYERFYEFYVKKSFELIKSKLPKYIDEKTMKHQFYLLEEELEYVIQKHFTEVILPNEENDILENCLDSELKKSLNSIKLEKLINELRKKALNLYKLLIQSHKESPILIKRFAEKITEFSVIYERQVSHLFNMFETKLENEVNKELDRQVKNMKFEGGKITDKIKNLCKQFQYNEWEINTKEIWEKVSHRILTQKLLDHILELSQKTTNLHFGFHFFGNRDSQIIGEHKELEKKCELFILELLHYFEQEDTGQQYTERAKETIRESLEKSLLKERKQFKITMLMLGIFLIFFYGEFMGAVKFLGLKKRSRLYLGNLYIVLTISLIAGSVAKRYVTNQHKL